MIESIEYFNGNLHVKIDGHRHVLESEKKLKSGEYINQSDLSNELPLVKSIAEAVLPIKSASNGKIAFNPRTGCVLFGGEQITPRQDISKFPNEVRAFARASRTEESIAAFNASQPPEYETKEVEVQRVVIKSGVPTLISEKKRVPKTRKVAVMDETGAPATRNGKEIFIEQPILKA